MALRLTANEVADITGSTVTDAMITVAATVIAEDTAYTVDQHVDTRGLPADTVKTAWAVVAVRAHERAKQAGAEAVAGETQADYSYNESVSLAQHFRHARLTDGYPNELLRVVRGSWAHI